MLLVTLCGTLLLLTGAQCLVDLCINEQTASECLQPSFYGAYRNQRYIDIDTKKITVVKAATGHAVDVLEVPGQYRLTFADVLVKEDLEYMIADMELTLISPGYGAINILNDCDERSHHVNVDGLGSNYCRYCDLCEMTKDIERSLETKQVLAFSNRETVRWDETCEKLKKGRRYTVARYIRLPDPADFEKRYGVGLDRLLEDALNKGVGTIQAQLRLLTLKPGVTKSYSNKFDRKECIDRCLNSNLRSQRECLDLCRDLHSQHDQAVYRKIFEVEGKRCNQSNGYEPQLDLAACYSVQFKFKATTRPIGAPAADCNHKPSNNPCGGNQPKTCCRLTPTLYHLKPMFGCTDSCVKYRGSCRKLYEDEEFKPETNR